MSDYVRHLEVAMQSGVLYWLIQIPFLSLKMFEKLFESERTETLKLTNVLGICLCGLKTKSAQICTQTL